MAAAWAAATDAQFAAGSVPPAHKAITPVYGYKNSTWAETYALEGALIASVTHKLSNTIAHYDRQAATPAHCQDNESTLTTFSKYMDTSFIPEGYFTSHQQARPVWRRLITRRAQLESLTTQWRRGHSDHPDINFVDALCDDALHHQALETAEEQFPDLNVIVEGMDQFSLTLTFPPQPHLPVAHPLLPLRATIPRATRSRDIATPNLRITLRHDGTRTQLHQLWSHLTTRDDGQALFTYQFMTAGINTTAARQGLTMTQKGYSISMRKPPTPTDEGTIPLHSPLTLSEALLIQRLRQGSWSVHDTITSITSSGETFKQMAFRTCAHCKELATLHHVVCECRHPDLVQLRSKLNAHCSELGTPHPHLPPDLWCDREHHFTADTPTNLANTRFQIPDTPPLPRRWATTNPPCLHARLGLRHEWDPPSKVYHQQLLATMHTTCASVRTWMQLDNKQSVPKAACPPKGVPPRRLLTKLPLPTLSEKWQSTKRPRMNPKAKPREPGRSAAGRNARKRPLGIAMTGFIIPTGAFAPLSSEEWICPPTDTPPTVPDPRPPHIFIPEPPPPPQRVPISRAQARQWRAAKCKRGRPDWETPRPQASAASTTAPTATTSAATAPAANTPAATETAATTSSPSDQGSQPFKRRRPNHISDPAQLSPGPTCWPWKTPTQTQNVATRRRNFQQPNKQQGLRLISAFKSTQNVHHGMERGGGPFPPR
jgi:hypothetical protein